MSLDWQRNQEVGIFTEKEGLMQTGRYHFQILRTLPFQFLKDIFDKTTESPVKTLRGTYKVELKIDSNIHSFWCTVKEKYEKILNIDLMGNLSQKITCRYLIYEDCIVSTASNQSAFSLATLINLYYKV